MLGKSCCDIEEPDSGASGDVCYLEGWGCEWDAGMNEEAED